GPLARRPPRRRGRRGRAGDVPLLAGARLAPRAAGTAPECISLTPVEMITALADALDLPELIRSWSTPDQRLRTLDALRRVAAEYADRARSASAPITLTGLRAVLDATDRGPDLTDTPGTVWVGTIHGAKGLEWPRVVVMQQDVREHAATSGVFVVPAEELDVMQPLACRSLRYWPAVL